MKFLFNLLTVFVALAFGSGAFVADVLPKNCVERQVLDFYTKWRDGSISSSVPSLEVIKLNSIDGLYEGFGVKISYTTGDMQLTGVNNFTIEQLSMSVEDLTASTTIRFPLLTLTGDQYTLKGRAYLMYTLKGSGFLNATFHNVEVTVETKFVAKNTILQLDEVSLNFSVSKIQVDLEHSSWPINKVLNNSAMDIVEKHRSELVIAARDMLKVVINEYLATPTSSNVMSMVGTDYCK